MMDNNEREKYVEAMLAIEREFQRVSQLVDPRMYKIQYSHIHQHPLLVLGYNPGGESGADDLLEQSKFYENYEHDIVYFREHQRYGIASGLCLLLEAMAGTTNSKILRNIPYLNVIWRRSANTSKLKVSESAASRECAGSLARIFTLVDPSHIVTTTQALGVLKKLHLTSPVMGARPTITTPNGSNTATVFATYSATLNATRKRVNIVAVGHPSKFARRSELWSKICNETGAALRDLGLSADQFREIPNGY
jgi:hypothetical protein